ncbi:hypothetical protein TWF694_002494 [Orbilia ellipsospora]|uniref:Uncharacterized protein n=1 Tax=Orbilia ellipsospora TaxID=2528407 RepID=A0AAV9X3H0_9PEZI
MNIGNWTTIAASNIATTTASNIITAIPKPTQDLYPLWHYFQSCKQKSQRLCTEDGLICLEHSFNTSSTRAQAEYEEMLLVWSQFCESMNLSNSKSSLGIGAIIGIVMGFISLTLFIIGVCGGVDAVKRTWGRIFKRKKQTGEEVRYSPHWAEQKFYHTGGQVAGKLGWIPLPSFKKETHQAIQRPSQIFRTGVGIAGSGLQLTLS